MSAPTRTMPEPQTAPAPRPTAHAAGQPEPPIPHSFAGYIKGMGPGIVVALSWLGTGDLINSSVSGANYGYVLMWALVIATLARFFVVSALTKYQLCNATNDQTILDGFQRVWKGFPMFLGICSVALGMVYHCFLFLGAGTALFYLFGEFGGQWGIFMWALVVLGLVIFMASRENEYKWLEHVANAAMATARADLPVGADRQRDQRRRVRPGPQLLDARGPRRVRRVAGRGRDHRRRRRLGREPDVPVLRRRQGLEGTEVPAPAGL